MSGELQEHIIQSGPAHSSIIELNAGIGHSFQDRLQGLSRIVDGSHQCSLIRTRGNLARDVRAKHALRALDIGNIVNGDLNALSSHEEFQLVAGSLSNNAALIDDRNVVGELVRFLPVVRCTS